jgi:hypothetical protein
MERCIARIHRGSGSGFRSVRAGRIAGSFPPVVRLNQQGRRSMDLLRWGLISFWAKDATIGTRCINAVSETIAG